MTDSPIDDVLSTLEREAIKRLHGEEETVNGPPLAGRRYDYTALSTAATCPRKYVADHVLQLPENLGVQLDSSGRRSGTNDADEKPSRAVRIGRLFHTVVEHQWPSGADRTEWKTYAAQLAALRGWTADLGRVETLIDAFFRSPVSDWEVDRSRVETRFRFNYDGREVTGVIDALPARPDGEVIVLDFKTGGRSPDDEQLRLYLLATHLDETLPIESAPTDAAFLRRDGDEFVLDPLAIGDLDGALANARETLRRWFAAAEDASYDDPTPGSHCRTCSYRGVCDAAEGQP